MRKKIIPVLIAVFLILVIAGGAAGSYLYQKYSYSKEHADLNAYYGLSQGSDVALVFNDVIMEEKGILRDGKCYLDLETVHAYLNDRFYVDYNEKLLLYVLPEETASVALGQNCADGYVAAFEESGTAYLALDYVKKYSDFNFTLYTEPNRVLLETVWEEVQTAEIKKDTAWRNAPSPDEA